MNQKLDQLDCFHVGVKALVLKPDNKVLVLKRDHPLKGIYWDIPGGRLQKGESQLATLFRELKEETGLENVLEAIPFITTLTDIRIPLHAGDVGLIFSVFLIHATDSFTPTLSDEHLSFEWCSFLNTAEKLKKQYPKELVEKIIHLGLS